MGENAESTPSSTADSLAWGVFQEVRGAWERIPQSTRDALQPAMRTALALRILALRSQEGNSRVCGTDMSKKPSAQEMRQRAEQTIAIAVKGLSTLELDGSESGGVLGLLDALHVLLSTLPMSAACNVCAVQCSWLQRLVQIPFIMRASVAEAEHAINQVTMTDKMGASSHLRRSLAVALIATLSRRLNSKGAHACIYLV